MLSEKDMEDAIARDSARYLGEDGLQLVERQYRIGGYIFDMLFTDRHGAKIIVEIQKGTLDRSHTYKILDYYDDFREKHPDEFIELMVVANRIPDERKKRLHAWGVEFREIPESEFASDDHASGVTMPLPSTAQQAKPSLGVDPVIEQATMKSYQVFKEQKNRFVEELLRADSNVALKVNWKELSEKNIRTHTNWFIGFVPNKWGMFKEGWFGVHFGFMYYRDQKTGIEYVRLPVGVEKPFKPEFADEFKKDVVESLKQRCVDVPECAIWPNVGFRGKKLIEPPLVLLDDDSSEKVLSRYLVLGEFVEVAAGVIRQYYDRGCFSVHLDFPT